MKKIKRINILSLAKFQSILGGLLGLLCGVIYSIGGLIIDSMVSLGWLSAEAMSTPGLSFGTVLALGALIVMPLIGAVAGFSLGIVAAILYNFTSRWFGGTKLNMS